MANGGDGAARRQGTRGGKRETFLKGNQSNDEDGNKEGLTHPLLKKGSSQLLSCPSPFCSCGSLAQVRVLLLHLLSPLALQEDNFLRYGDCRNCKQTSRPSRKSIHRARNTQEFLVHVTLTPASSKTSRESGRKNRVPCFQTHRQACREEIRSVFWEPVRHQNYSQDPHTPLLQPVRPSVAALA